MAAVITFVRRIAVGTGLAVVVLAGATPVDAQGLAAAARASTDARAAGGAESFARDYMATLQSRNWDKVARMMHPIALVEFRELLQPLILSTNPKAAEVRAAFTGSDSVEAINAMPDAAYFSAVMSRVFALMPKEVTDAMFNWSANIIGSVAENPETTHVLCRVRLSVSGVTATEIEVLTTKRTADGWAAMLDGSLSTTLKGLSASLR